MAHRGQTLGGPHENTLAAFDRAIDLGSHMVEFDVRRTKDNVMVVHHGPRIGGRLIRAMTYEEIKTWDHGQHVPMLEEVYKLISPRAMAYIELKEAGYEDEVLALTKQYFGYDRFVMKSFQDRVVRALKDLDPAACVGLGIGDTYHFQLLWVPLSDFWPWRRIERTRADFLSYSCILAPVRIAHQARRRGVPIVIWGLNDERRVRMYLRWTHAKMWLTNIPELIGAANAPQYQANTEHNKGH